MHYLTGHETTVRRIHHRLGFVWSRTTPGWASPSNFVSYLPCTIHLVNCQNSCCARGEGALTECVAGEGREWARGEGGLSRARSIN